MINRWMSLTICANADWIFYQTVFGFSTSFGFTEDPINTCSIFFSCYWEEEAQRWLYIRHPASEPIPANLRKLFLPKGENNELVMVLCFLEKVEARREKRENILIVDIVIWRLLIVSILVHNLLKLRSYQKNKKCLQVYYRNITLIYKDLFMRMTLK
jgi:hypothetical protein